MAYNILGTVGLHSNTINLLDVLYKNPSGVKISGIHFDGTNSAPLKTEADTILDLYPSNIRLLLKDKSKEVLKILQQEFPEYFIGN